MEKNNRPSCSQVHISHFHLFLEELLCQFSCSVV